MHHAAKLFFKFGIRSVSIDDICKAMGISKKTFYVSFDTKDALVEVLVEQAKSHMHAHFCSTFMSDDVGEWLRCLAQVGEKDDHDIRNVPQLVFDLQKYYPSLFANYQQYAIESQKECLQHTLEAGKKQGFIRTDLNVEHTAHFIAKIHSDSIRDIEYYEQANIPMAAYTHNTISILLRGILTDKGWAVLQEGKQESVQSEG